MLEKKTIIILIGALIVTAGLIVWGIKDDKTNIVDDPNAIVYYWGDGCPHCRVLQEFIDANNITEKVSFIKKEIWGNKENAAEMARRAKACGINQEGMGVPFIYGGNGKCYVGEPDARKFFSEKAGIVNSEPAAEN